MKKIILSIASLCMTGIAFGQWTTSGSSIYTNATSVGVGTATPLGYLSFPNHGQILTIGNNSWANRITLATSWNATIGDYTDLTVPGANSNTALFRLSQAGNVGIGNSSPTEKLCVEGNILVNGGIKFTPSNYFRGIVGNSNSLGLALFSNNDGSNGSSVLMYSNNASNTTGRIDLVAGDGNGSTTNNSTAFNFMQYSGGLYSTYMGIFRDGGVAIGNISSRPTGYKLFVEKGILTEKIRVAVQGTANWADHVFAANYNLKPLNEVESFIKENQHLPEIPSAKDVVKDGVDLGAMDAKLLQKIEELTLYMIQQQKQIEKQQNEINSLKVALKK